MRLGAGKAELTQKEKPPRAGKEQTAACSRKQCNDSEGRAQGHTSWKSLGTTERGLRREKEMRRWR